MRKKNVPFFLLYTISGENIQVKKNVLTNILVESSSLGFGFFYGFLYMAELKPTTINLYKST